MRVKLVVAVMVFGLVLSCAESVWADAIFADDFETPWSGTYAPGWQNVEYRHGKASHSRMTQTTTHVYSGSYALALDVTAAGDPEAWTNWWGGVVPTFIPSWVLAKECEPWVSVMFYDTTPAGGLPGGYLAAVPSTNIPNDWTDLQHGCRWGQEEHYWYGSAPANGGAGWRETDIDRTEGWHQFKMTLSSTGQLDYYIDGVLVGTSPRTDYLDLAGIYLGVWLKYSDFDHSTVYFDRFQVGSSLPEPATFLLLGGALAGGLGILRRRKGLLQ